MFTSFGKKVKSTIQFRWKRIEQRCANADQSDQVDNQTDIRSMKLFTRRFTLIQVIGGGAQALVKSAFDRDQNINVALKIFDKRDMSPQALERAYQEQLFMATMDHRNITKCHACFEDDKTFVIVTEMMSCDMNDLMNSLNKQVKEEYVKKMFYQMLLAVNHLHSKNIIHRDIKLDNFLIRQNKKQGNLEIKLTDLGFGCQYDPCNLPSIKCGTLTNIAPEIFMRPTYDLKVDMWSMGIVLFELLCGESPYEYQNDKQFIHQLFKKKFDLYQDGKWLSVSEEAKDLLENLMQRDPNKRYSVEDALNHPWFNGFSQESQCDMALTDLFSRSQ